VPPAVTSSVGYLPRATPEEASSILRISRTAVCELVTQGQIESFKVGRSRRIPLDALAEFGTHTPRTRAAVAGLPPVDNFHGDRVPTVLELRSCRNYAA
jgi:excisionase family DNA binding protein